MREFKVHCTTRDQNQKARHRVLRVLSTTPEAACEAALDVVTKDLPVKHRAWADCAHVVGDISHGCDHRSR